MLPPQLARIHTFEVVPSLPDRLQPLLEIARNLWWAWHPEAVELFLRLDRDGWRESHHNPVKMLGSLGQARLDAAARDEPFLSAVQRVHERLEHHLKRSPAISGDTVEGDPTIAYFCSEFGLTECLQIYSGGLGVLAGDHLKSASELGLNLIAVGLLYRHGYFQQYLAADGWQQERLPDLDFANLPVEPIKGDDGEQIKVGVTLPGREVRIALWKVRVGRVPLYLLDTNLPENSPQDRGITAQLYGGDAEHRMKQEIVLGIGGVRALEAIGIRPDVCHMNEGHSAFLALERIRRLIDQHDLSFDEARQQASASHVFTTHTPVPAGIDRFPPAMLRAYFDSYVPGLKLDMEGLLALGRENVFNKDEPFSMAVLAIRTADGANGVSKLHGEVSRSMWRSIWPNVPENEIPIDHVTNGVHARTWLNADLNNLMQRYVGSRWEESPGDHGVWHAIHDVPDEELWRVHERRREKLIVWARRTLRRQLEARGENATRIRDTVDSLSDEALTVGFARRFATYKRGDLFLRNADRLLRMLANADRPIQFLFAGKAHPADAGGKELIRRIVRFAAESDAAHRIVFIENYDMHVARYLVQGCDVWLNNPRRGMEASGTSGMKAALNGVLNVSILDGWWDEGYDSEVGWAIGRREAYNDPHSGDEIESASLYDLLENQVLPMFFDRDQHNVPRMWVQKMKASIARLGAEFNTNRMVEEYARKLYFPAARRAARLGADDLKPAVELANQKARLRRAWPTLSIEAVEAGTDRPLGVNEPMPIVVTATLGELEPAEVEVQVYAGPLDNDGHIRSGQTTTLAHARGVGEGRHRFTGEIATPDSGRHGAAVRIVPGGEMFEGVVEPGLVLWEGTPVKKTASDVIAERTA